MVAIKIAMMGLAVASALAVGIVLCKIAEQQKHEKISAKHMIIAAISEEPVMSDIMHSAQHTSNSKYLAGRDRKPVQT